MRRLLTSACVLVLFATTAQAELAITEWMYSPGTGPYEYIEFTNVGTAPVDMTGWSEDDSNRTAGKHPLSAFGIVQPGESVIACEGSDAGAFRTYWGLDASVKIVAYGTSDNLGRSDEINLYDAGYNLIDRLTYNDQGGLGPRTQGVGGNIPLAALWTNSPNAAVLSAVGDSWGSYRGNSGTGDIGNPGVYTAYAAPEPSSIVLCVIGLALAAVGIRKRLGA